MMIVDKDGKAGGIIGMPSNPISFFRAALNQQPIIKAVEFTQEFPVDAAGMTSVNCENFFEDVGSVSGKASLYTIAEPSISIPLATTAMVSTAVSVPFRGVALLTGYGTEKDLGLSVANLALQVTVKLSVNAVASQFVREGENNVTMHVGPQIVKMGLARKVGDFASKSLTSTVSHVKQFFVALLGASVDTSINYVKKKDDRKKKKEDE